MRECLEENFDKRRYVHGDVRWRNIGRDWDGNAVVFDLETVRSKDEKDAGWVEGAIEQLKKRF